MSVMSFLFSVCPRASAVHTDSRYVLVFLSLSSISMSILLSPILTVADLSLVKRSCTFWQITKATEVQVQTCAASGPPDIFYYVLTLAAQR